MKTTIMAILSSIWEVLVKDLLIGIVMTSVKDVAKKFVDKTPWAVIAERLLTRLLVFCFKWLATLSTNKLWVDTVNDFLSVLEGQGLKEARPIKATSKNSDPSIQPTEHNTQEPASRQT